MYEESLNLFNKSISLDEYFEYPLINKWLALIQLWKYEEAIDVFKKLLDISIVIKNKEKTDLYFNIWYAYFCNLDYNNAIKFFKKDLEINNWSEETKNYIWLSFFYMWDYQKSIKYFEEILWENYVINKDNSYIVNNLWISLLEKNNYEKALELFNEVIKISDDPISSYYNRGILYENIWDKESAIKDFEKVYSLNDKYNNISQKLKEYKK